MLKNQSANHEMVIAFSGTLVLILFLIFFLPGNSFAAGYGVAGQCSTCHTMHNSQGGAQMSETGSANPSLLVGASTCLGCHTGDNDGSNTTPYVYTTTAEPTFGGATGTCLSGGNFYWVRVGGDDAKGHNIFSGNPDTLTEAPGDTASCGTANNCHLNLHTNITYDLDNGEGSKTYQNCQKCHISPKHHNNTSGKVEAAPWFRWLAGHEPAGKDHGVTGIEHDGWGYQAAAGGTDHNEYLGISGTKTSAGGFDLGYTMTAYCTGCHGDFHIEKNGSSQWIRHPSDHVIPPTGEYASAFGGGGAGTWDPTVPVARPSLTSASNAVTLNTDMVMCLSCHVAHGSPNDDMLRWDYELMIAGTAGAGQGKGCFVCHTEKDGS